MTKQNIAIGRLLASRVRQIFGVSALVAALCLCAGEAVASGTSTVYYHADRNYAVQSDGTGNAALAGGGSGMPSYLLHNGIRWFVGDEVPYDPSLPHFGNMVFESNTGLTLYVPVNWGNIDIGTDVSNYFLDYFNNGQNRNLQWVLGDGEITFVGREVDANRNVTQVGIYALAVTFDSSGNISALSAPYLKLGTPAIATSDGPKSVLYTGYPGLHYSWNSTSTAVAFCQSRAVCTLDSAGLHTLKSWTSGTAGDAEWAPGSVNKILFTYSTGATSRDTSTVYTIPVAGGALTQLDQLKVFANGGYYHYEVPHWTPDGAYVIYRERFEKSNVTWWMRRCSSGGSGAVTLLSLGTNGFVLQGCR